jgi:hypothetical protein
MNKRDRIKRARNAGIVSSPAKTDAVRENGKLGGRPRNPEIAKIMAQRGCTRAMGLAGCSRISPIFFTTESNSGPRVNTCWPLYFPIRLSQRQSRLCT